MLGFDHDQRRFDFAADMLQKLGVARVRVMTNNPVKIAALENAGIEVVSDQRVLGRKTVHNLRYLASKRDRWGICSSRICSADALSSRGGKG